MSYSQYTTVRKTLLSEIHSLPADLLNEFLNTCPQWIKETVLASLPT